MDSNSLITKNSEVLIINIDTLCSNSIDLIKYARKTAVNKVNLVQLMTYYALGYWILKEQQSGKERAGYGKKVIQTLSEVLNKEFGKGFSVDTLENARKFYLTYRDQIGETVFSQFTEEKSETVFRYLEENYQKLPDKNPTIGILLCKEKNDAVVQMTLPKDSNIFAAEYSLYLPDKQMLQKKLQEWIDEEIGGADNENAI